MEYGRLLGFIVSKDGIRVDPLKVEAILQFPSSKTIRQLQSLQGKATFLRIFIPNYVEICKVFMCLLKQDTLFIWDEQYQHTFVVMKQVLMSTTMLSPPDYTRFVSILATTKSTLGMVLFQEDDSS